MGAAKIALIAVWPLAGLGLVAFLLSLAGELPAEHGEPVRRAAWWLATLAGLYAVNWIVAWRMRDSWTATLVRLLAWGAAAYLCVSNLLDIFAADRSLLSRILDFSAGAEVSAPRGRALAWLLGAIMAVVCIGLGFERKVEEGSPSDS